MSAKGSPVTVPALQIQALEAGYDPGLPIVRGASLVVWAIRDGRDVAKSMHQHLVANARTQARQPVAA